VGRIIQGLILGRRKYSLSLLQTIHTGSAAHPLSYSVGKCSLPGGEAVGVWGWLSLSSAGVMNGRSYISAPNGSCCGLDRENVTFPKLCSDACQLNTSMKHHGHCSVAMPKAMAESACSQHRRGAGCNRMQPERQTRRKHHRVSHIILLRTSVSSWTPSGLC
jgi:hypothetical protein